MHVPRHAGVFQSIRKSKPIKHPPLAGSDRVPIEGLRALQPPFTISRNGGHSDRLPTAHTCFNHLLLPQYEAFEALQDRLQLAIANAEGFGLR